MSTTVSTPKEFAGNFCNSKLLAGESPPAQPILIPPLGVVRRQSTETLAIDDPVVAATIRNVRDHLDEPFGVERLLEASGVSRRQLEGRFQKSMGASPYTVITKLRIDRARQLLVAPGRRTLTDIAATCGFHDLRRFRLTFERHVGISPAKYRKERRPGEQEEPRRPSRSRPRTPPKHASRLHGKTKGNRPAKPDPGLA